ncbi:hypothetical protein BH11ARM2_BH11ARM2_35930 [soil metagenome]
MTGKAVGGVVRFGTDLLGDATHSSFIKEVGRDAEWITIRSGGLIGQAADGVGGAVKGAIKKDRDAAKSGLGEFREAAQETAIGVVRGTEAMILDGVTVCGRLKAGDTVAATAAARNLAKSIVVGMLAVTVVKGFDGVGSGDGDESKK